MQVHRGTTRSVRRLRAGGTACALALVFSAALSGCGDQDDTDPLVDDTASTETSPPVTPAPPSTSAPSPSSSPSSSLSQRELEREFGLTTHEFTYVEDSGVKVSALLSVTQVGVATSETFLQAWRSLAPTAPATTCAETPTRDAVILGAVSFANETPGFEPENLSLRILAASVSPTFLYWHANGDSSCADRDGALTVSSTDGEVGPIPFELVLEGVVGPNGVDQAMEAQALSDLEIQLATPDGSSRLVAGAGTGALDDAGGRLGFAANGFYFGI